MKKEYKKIHETQGQEDFRNIIISKVGIKNVSTKFSLDIFGGIDLQGEILISVTLPGNKKGTHMSRMSLFNTKIFNKNLNYNFLRNEILNLYNELDKNNLFIEINGKCIREKLSPIRKFPGYESFDLSIITNYDGNKFEIFGILGIYGISLCPASKNNSQFGAHNQRSKIIVKFPITDFLKIEKYIENIEKSFSCKVYPTLKIEDEIYVTEKSYLNPKFVEDIIRDTYINLEKNNLDFLEIEVENYESIHTHNAFAKIIK